MKNEPEKIKTDSR